MEVVVGRQPVQQAECDAVIVGVFADGEFGPSAAAVDSAGNGLLKRLFERGEIKGKPFEATTLYDVPGFKTPLVLVVGLGERAKFDGATAYRTAAAATRALAAKPRRVVGCYLSEGPAAAQTATAVAGAIVGTQGADLYRAEKKRTPFAKLEWSNADAAAVERGTILGEGVNLARKLVNEPPSTLYPETFAAQAQEIARSTGLSIEIWDQQKLEAERCGSLLAVAVGSLRPPRLVIVEHKGGKPGEPPIALVGKGVTFDSGGLSLKPAPPPCWPRCKLPRD